MLLKSLLFVVFLGLFLITGNAAEDQENFILGENDSFDLAALSKMASNTRGNVVVQIVNHGNVGFLNSGSGKPESLLSSANNKTSHLSNVESSFSDSPPPPEEAAKMARYIVKNSNWTSLATTSTRDPTKGYPFNNVVAVSDGPVGKSTGVPYMYVTSLDLSQKDLQVDPRASLTMTLAQTDYCRTQVLDPEDPRCAHVILTGEFVKIQNGTQEADFARQAMFTKHPIMPSWPPDHGFFFAKLHISNIIVLDYFGGAKTVTPKDYYKANIY